MLTVAATTIPLEPEWAGVLLVGLPIMFGALAWYIKATVASTVTKAIAELEARLDTKLDKVARDAREDTQAVWHNQVEWMDREHHVDGNKIRRPPED